MIKRRRRRCETVGVAFLRFFALKVGEARRSLSLAGIKRGRRRLR